jgi:hypothetical protein
VITGILNKFITARVHIMHESWTLLDARKSCIAVLKAIICLVSHWRMYLRIINESCNYPLVTMLKRFTQCKLVAEMDCVKLNGLSDLLYRKSNFW